MITSIITLLILALIVSLYKCYMIVKQDYYVLDCLIGLDVELSEDINFPIIYITEDIAKEKIVDHVLKEMQQIDLENEVREKIYYFLYRRGKYLEQLNYLAFCDYSCEISMVIKNVNVADSKFVKKIFILDNISTTMRAPYDFILRGKFYSHNKV